MTESRTKRIVQLVPAAPGWTAEWEHDGDPVPVVMWALFEDLSGTEVRWPPESERDRELAAVIVMDGSLSLAPDVEGWEIRSPSP